MNPPPTQITAERTWRNLRMSVIWTSLPSRYALRSRSSRQQLLHGFALLDQLVRGRLDLLLREVVVLEALDHFPAIAGAPHRESELQALGDAVLAAARDGQRNVVPLGCRVPDARDRVDRGVRCGCRRRLAT